MSLFLRQSFPQTSSRAFPAAIVIAIFMVLAAARPAFAQTETILYSFCPQTGCADGSDPEAGLVMDSSGNFYGTTEYGGAGDEGAVFKVTAAGAETVLYSFKSEKKDGTLPQSPLLIDPKGNLYGTASQKGAHGGGTVFRISPEGKETILYNFCSLTNCADGNEPVAGLIRDKAGNFYGTTEAGGAGNVGTVFKLSPTGVETVLHSFSGTDGSSPLSSLVMDAAGNLYGTTWTGGDLNFCSEQGCGTVFKVTPEGTETVLYSFCSGETETCTDGQLPPAGLILDKAGNLYGVTNVGGTNGLGIIFRISSTGVETILHNFAGYPNDGEHPLGGLIMDSARNLYGTTYEGGTDNDGVVFKLNGAGTLSLLHSFEPSGTDGFWPFGSLLMDSAGNLYGTTDEGGADHTGGGTVYEITP